MDRAAGSIIIGARIAMPGHGPGEKFARDGVRLYFYPLAAHRGEGVRAEADCKRVWEIAGEEG